MFGVTLVYVTSSEVTFSMDDNKWPILVTFYCICKIWNVCRQFVTFLNTFVVNGEISRDSGFSNQLLGGLHTSDTKCVTFLLVQWLLKSHYLLRESRILSLLLTIAAPFLQRLYQVVHNMNLILTMKRYHRAHRRERDWCGHCHCHSLKNMVRSSSGEHATFNQFISLM